MTKKRKRCDVIPVELPRLSPREVDVALKVAEGLSYPEISQALCLGYETVRSHIKKLGSKTGYRCKSQLAMWAARHIVWLKAREDAVT